MARQVKEFIFCTNTHMQQVEDSDPDYIGNARRCMSSQERAGHQKEYFDNSTAATIERNYFEMLMLSVEMDDDNNTISTYLVFDEEGMLKNLPPVSIGRFEFYGNVWLCSVKEDENGDVIEHLDVPDSVATNISTIMEERNQRQQAALSRMVADGAVLI